MLKTPENYPDLWIPGISIGKTTFNPYMNNGGSVVAIAGDDFAVIGADTRLSNGYSIATRKQKKLFKLSPRTVLGSSGCWCDMLTLSRLVEARMKIYEHEHGKPMSTPATAQMLSNMMYYKRFCPYYTASIIAGLDAGGKGCVYQYDAIGHCERTMYYATGTAGTQLNPLLDNQIGMKNMRHAVYTPCVKERATALIKDVFMSAAERDLFTGDSIIIMIITDRNIKEETFALRRD